MNKLFQRLPEKLMRLREVLVTTLLSWIPTLFLGVVLRNLLYRSIFAGVGQSVYIQDGAEFLGTAAIALGDNVHIYRGVRIDGRNKSNPTHNDNRVYLNSHVSLQKGVDIGALENTLVEIGERTFIGPYTSIRGPGNIKIGKDCLIASNLGIFANNHRFDNPLQKIKDQGVTRQGIVIEDNCWLGHGVTVLDGVTIGEGSVIGAGAIVTKDIPPGSVAVGVPAKVISCRYANSPRPASVVNN